MWILRRESKIRVLPNMDILVGRTQADDCIVLTDRSVSRKHAKMVCSKEQVLIQNYGKGGTFINGRLIEKETVFETCELSFGPNVYFK